jgi:hypothetical protein
MELRSGSLGAGGRCYGKCDRSGDAGLLNLTPESSSHSFSRERSVMMLRFACSERNGSVVIAVPPDHLQRRVKGSPYLY